MQRPAAAYSEACKGEGACGVQGGGAPVGEVGPDPVVRLQYHVDAAHGAVLPGVVEEVAQRVGRVPAADRVAGGWVN